MPWVLTRGERRRRNRLQGGRLHLGTVADIKSEWWPTSSRNRWPACVGIHMPHSGASWQPRKHPATQPHEYIRGGTTKILTLFHPASGQVRLQPAARGTNAVLHPWLREHLSEILTEGPASAPARDPAVTRAAWAVWPAGLTMPFTLPHDLPPLRLLLVWDNLAGHKTPDLVLWLCAHGIMPLYTPVSGSWLNMAESIQRVLKRRALPGQHPHTQIGRASCRERV